MDEAEDLIEAATELADALVEIGAEVEDANHAASNLLEAAAQLVVAAKGGQFAGILAVLLWVADVAPGVVDTVKGIRLPWDRGAKALRKAAMQAEREGKVKKAERLRKKAKRRE